MRVIMGTRRSACTIAIVLFLTFVPLDVTFGANWSEGGNFRVGANVIVASDETVSEGLVVAGANVEVRGNVEGGLKAFGGNVTLSGEVEGDVSFGGGNVLLSGRYSGKVRGGGANVVLSGTFDDDVEVGGAKITVASGANIRGDLRYSSAVFDRQEGSQISGEVARRTRRAEWEGARALRQKGKTVLSSLRIILWIISIPALIIVGVIINALFPKQTDAIVTAISASPWKNLGVGFVFLVVVPVGIIIALITVVGIPVGVIGLLVYGILVYVSRIYIGVWVGRKVLSYFRESLATAFFWPLVVGTIIIALLILIPFVGWFFRLFFLLISLGAMWIVLWRSIPARR
jgi:hypothetical protein